MPATSRNTPQRHARANQDQLKLSGIAHRPVEIPALSGGDTADDQPYDKQHRSDVHHGLHSMSAKWNETASRKKPTRAARYSVQFRAFSRNLEAAPRRHQRPGKMLSDW